MDRLEWLFGKPTDSEIKTAAMMLFLFGGATVFMSLGGKVLRLVIMRALRERGMTFVPRSLVLATVIGLIVLLAIGSILGALVGFRIDRTASSGAKLAMVRLLDAGFLIFCVGMAARLIVGSLRSNFQMQSLAAATFFLLLALWTLRPFRQRLRQLFSAGSQ